VKRKSLASTVQVAVPSSQRTAVSAWNAALGWKMSEGPRPREKRHSISKIAFFALTEPAPVSLWMGNAPNAVDPFWEEVQLKTERSEIRPLYELKIITQMAAAHQLREFDGKCEKLHGHNWKIEVCVAGQDLRDNGILIDFKLIKEAAQKVLHELDHSFLNELECFKSVNPSSENIARHIFLSLSKELDDVHVRVSKVTAWESDSACASYTES
jgi:6-pyruvoyltetrahydropterin/6-carboxytetrahydropterin synthase